jgi:hypothetical protein
MPARCAVRVQKPEQFNPPVDKDRFRNDLHLHLCTAPHVAVAPIVCVDVFAFSVKVVPVDGRKGRHTKVSQPEVDWVISQTGRPERQPDRKEN